MDLLIDGQSANFYPQITIYNDTFSMRKKRSEAADNPVTRIKLQRRH